MAFHLCGSHEVNVLMSLKSCFGTSEIYCNEAKAHPGL